MNRAALLLFGVLAGLLSIRGVYWITVHPGAGQLVFVFATLLPLLCTLFVEQLLRRHHPFWLKVFALSVSVFFGLGNLFSSMISNEVLLLAFLGSFVFTLLANAWFLIRAEIDSLNPAELRMARAMVAVAAVGALLAVTDFREELPYATVRLGGLGPLIMICFLLGAATMTPGVRMLVIEPIIAFVFALVLAAAFAMASVGTSDFDNSVLRGLPVAVAWILLTVIVVRVRSLSIANPSNRFLRWLLHARLDSASGFISSLRKLSTADGHVVLGPGDLSGYAVDRWFGSEPARREPLALAELRAAKSGLAGERLDVAEEMIDLLEKHEMTHIILVSEKPMLIVLFNLPPGASAVLGQLSAGIVMRIARRLADGQQHA